MVYVEELHTGNMLVFQVDLKKESFVSKISCTKKQTCSKPDTKNDNKCKCLHRLVSISATFEFNIENNNATAILLWA